MINNLSKLILTKVVSKKLEIFNIDDAIIKNYISDGLIRRITGTLDGGKIANSVTTAVTKSAGVTSYVMLRRFKDFFVFQFARHDFFASYKNVSVSASASPENIQMFKDFSKYSSFQKNKIHL